MKKKMLRLFLTILAILLSYFIIDNMFFPTSISYNEKNYTEMIKVDGSIVYINYSIANQFLEEINDYIDYDSNLADIYNDIVNKYYNDKNVKLYDDGNNKVLEIKYKKKDAEKLFSSIMDTSKGVTIKILFNKKWNLKNINLTKLNYKINREDVIRENIVATARSELGNHASKYWKWWGVNYHMEWCCVFVSYIADANGIMDKYIPRFAGVSAGIRYFKSKNQFKLASKYTPKPGDIVFFDFPSEYFVDHVGIVEKVENGKVYTIEGNANSDYVKRKEYELDSPYLYAYGVPDYKNVR